MIVGGVRASNAWPDLCPPVSIDGRWLLDGALVNPVPVSVCRALGARIVIAVNLNADAFGQSTAEAENDSRRLPPAAAGAMTGMCGVALVRQLVSRENGAPSLFSVMSSSLNIVQDRLTRSRLAGDPPDVTIAPRLGDIGLMQFDRAEESIAAGEH